MGGIWQGGDKMGLVDALMYSLTGMATVFMALIALAVAIIILSKLLDAMGFSNKASAKKETKASATQTNTTAQNVVPKVVEEDTQEYAVILAAISEHSRIPVERLKINSITKR